METITYAAMERKLAYMEEILEVIKMPCSISVKNYLLLKRFLNKNGIRITREYDHKYDVLKIGISLSYFDLWYNSGIDNFTSLRDGEMAILTHIYQALNDIRETLNDPKYLRHPARYRFNCTFDEIDKILFHSHNKIASNITFTILNEIFGSELSFSKKNDPYQYVFLGDRYLNFKFKLRNNFYDEINDKPYLFLKHMFNKITSKRDLLLLNILYKKEYIYNLNCFDIKMQVDNISGTISLYDSNDYELAIIMFDDNKPSKASVIFQNNCPKSWELLSALSSFTRCVEEKLNNYIEKRDGKYGKIFNN